MFRFLVSLILCSMTAQFVFADNSRQAERYVKESEYYQKKADGYRREARYFLKKAEGYEREAAYYTKKAIPTGQRIISAEHQEQWTVINPKCDTQPMPMTKRLII